MKKLLTLLILLTATLARGQGFTGRTSLTATAPLVGDSVYLIGSGAVYHQLTWNVSGTVSSCSVQVDSSVNGTVWVSGGVIGSQTCTTNGQSAISNSIPNYVRIQFTAVGGGGSVTAVWYGYNTTSGGSGITSLNGLTGSTQTFATPGTTGTAPGWSSATTIHTLNIPLASASGVTAGLLSNTDYASFAAKQAALSFPLGSTQGGTGNGFTKFTGPTTAERTFTLPDASATILTTNALVSLAQGGSNQNSWTASRCVQVNAGGTALESAAAACGAGGGPGTGTRHGFPIWVTGSTLGTASPVPTTKGTFIAGYVNPTDAATDGQIIQDGVTNRTVSGTTSTDTLLFTDRRVEYTGSVAVAVALPAPATLENTGFYVRLSNHTTGSATAVTVTPATWTVNGAATLVIAQGQSCTLTVGAGTDWSADCASPPITAGTGISLTRSAYGVVVTNTGPITVASGAQAMGTSSISANTCATVVTVSATGVLSTDSISFAPNASIKAVTGYTPAGTLTIVAYPTTDNVNFDVCNKNQTSAVTPGAVTLNWAVRR